MSVMMLHYFAYGSNLHPVRLIERIPSAELIGAVELPGYRLEFHKTSEDESGKCNAFATGSSSDLIHGALYQLAFEHKPILDRIEGAGHGGYIASEISVRHRHHEYACFTYLAEPSHLNDDLEPYHWYKQLVVLGAKHLELSRGVYRIYRISEVEGRPESKKAARKPNPVTENQKIRPRYRRKDSSQIAESQSRRLK